MNDQHKTVKRIEEICNEFDYRASVVGFAIARLELATTLAETENQLAALEAAKAPA